MIRDITEPSLILEKIRDSFGLQLSVAFSHLVEGNKGVIAIRRDFWDDNKKLIIRDNEEGLQDFFIERALHDPGKDEHVYHTIHFKPTISDIYEPDWEVVYA